MSTGATGYLPRCYLRIVPTSIRDPQSPRLRDQDHGPLAQALMLTPEASLTILRGDDVTGAPVCEAAAVLLFSERSDQVEPSVRSVLSSLSPGASVWVAYPTARQGVLANRRAFIEAIGLCGLEPAAEVDLGRRWAALLVRPTTPRPPTLARVLRLSRRARAMPVHPPRPGTDRS